MSMRTRFDTIVLGAGPAGVAAATHARRLGLNVAIVDEATAAGGQVFRAPSSGLAPGRPDESGTPGDALRARLAASGVTAFFEHRVWSIVPGFAVLAAGPAAPLRIEAPALIVATGAYERHIPVPGWTLPGVIGLAAATVLLKSHKVLPGRNVVVAGSGPLLLLVAALILANGGSVGAIVDAAPRARWISALPAMLARPDLLARGLSWLLAVKRAGVPIYSAHAITRVHGEDEIGGVTIAPVDRRWAPIAGPSVDLPADALCVGFGLIPGTDITGLLGAEHRFDDELGGWAPVFDRAMMTTVPGLFVAGDAGGVRGADAAPLAGELAAAGARSFLHGARAASADTQATAARWRRSAGFGAAMSAVSTPQSGAQKLIAPDTIVCRCEGLTRSALDAAIAGGTHTIDGLKSVTRCGMGPCGGRVCGEAAAMILAAGTGADRPSIGQPTRRPPLRPVPLGAIAGTFDYDDLPIAGPTLT
jgi:thioredoxin reductase/bacterioferritin-associated ferredoxin